MALVLDGTGSMTFGNGAISGLSNAAIPSTKIGAGAVLQVVQSIKTDTFSTASISPTFVDITGLSVSITPISSSSKIYINANIAVGTSGAQLHFFRLMRNSTAICVGDSAGSRAQVSFAWYYGNSDYVSHTGSLPLFFLDSPLTTSATTYKLQMAVQSNTAWVNRNNSDTDSAQYGARATSTITVMEIAA